jgi:hypothetical protein
MLRAEGKIPECLCENDEIYNNKRHIPSNITDHYGAGTANVSHAPKEVVN